MDDYIKRNDILFAINGDNPKDRVKYPQWYIDRIKSVPAVDVRPVVRGKWILHEDGSATCSHCKTRQIAIYDDDSFQHYCGNCGAQMDLEDDE